MTRALYGPVLSGGNNLGNCRVVLRGRTIQQVLRGAPPEADDEVVTAGWITPGLIDVQVNGTAGNDITAASQPNRALTQVANALARHGVTAFCPTLVSSPPDQTLALLGALTRAACPPRHAQSLGIHLEGPFVNPSFRGVHDPHNIRTPDTDEIAAWLRAGPPAIVTLAPEQPGAPEATRRLVAAGVRVSLGHSAATREQGQAGLAAGASLATHLFNAMPPLHHRQPGLVGALLTSDAWLCLIADGVHVDPSMIDLVLRVAGAGRVVLVSDALAAAGAPPGNYRLGEQDVQSDGLTVRRLDGTLAGSATLLDGCLRNLRHWFPYIEPARLVQMATGNPAAALGPAVAAHKGQVAAGFDADLLVLDDDFRVRRAWVRGEEVEAPAEPGPVGILPG